MCRYGDIYMAKIKREGSLRLTKQPVLVISADKANKNSSVVNVVPIVDASEQDKLLGYVSIGDYGMSEKNIAVIEEIKTLNQTQLLVKVGSIRGTVYAEQIRQKIKSYLGL